MLIDSSLRYSRHTVSRSLFPNSEKISIEMFSTALRHLGPLPLFILIPHLGYTSFILVAHILVPRVDLVRLVSSQKGGVFRHPKTDYLESCEENRLYSNSTRCRNCVLTSF